jgi:23S rRNA (uracil1939-C5)-methyltransferase
MIEKTRIGAIGRQGDGVAETPSGRVHVPFALPGELAEIEHDGERAALLKVVEPSADRVAPVCRHFGVCGGCALQHWNSRPYASWKRDLVATALSHAGIETNLRDTVDAHGAGRIRAVFHCGRGKNPAAFGFAQRRSHEIVEIEECPVLAKPLESALPIGRELAKILAMTGKPADLHFTAAREGIDIDIRGPGKLPAGLERKLVSFAAAHRIARLTAHGQTIAQLVPPTIRIGKAVVVLPPAPFLQATEAGAVFLAEKVLAVAQGAKAAADLFCGVGTFALRLAEQTKVSAFDSSDAAVKALAVAAKSPGLKPVTAAPRDLFRWPLTSGELKSFDFVVLDPPRQGAEAQARELAESKLKRVAYVSCDAESFARDARILNDAGLRLREVTPLDQFRYAAHVELVGIFER